MVTLIGCGDDGPTDDDDDDDDDNNPTVVDYTGSGPLGGMNISGFFETSSTDTITVDQLIAFDTRDSYSATFVSLTEGDRTYMTINMVADDVIPISATTNRDLRAAVRISVPDSTTGTWDWKDDVFGNDFSIEFDYGDDDVTYSKVIEGSTTFTKNNMANGPTRDVSGTFSGVLESPDGKKIAVRGRFD